MTLHLIHVAVSHNLVCLTYKRVPSIPRRIQYSSTTTLPQTTSYNYTMATPTSYPHLSPSHRPNSSHAFYSPMHSDIGRGRSFSDSSNTMFSFQSDGGASASAPSRSSGPNVGGIDCSGDVHNTWRSRQTTWQVSICPHS